MEPNEMMDVLARPFKRESIRYRKGGGNKDLAYLDGATVIRRLNEACIEWSFTVIAERREGEVLLAHGQLTIPGLGTRDGIGVQRIAPNSGEDFYKGHFTDSLKKCAKLFGVGLELYGDDTEAGDHEPRQMEPQQRAAIESQHERNVSPQTQPPPMRLPATRTKSEPDGADRARVTVVAKAEEKGVPVLDGDTYDIIAESVNKALMDAGKGVEVRTDANGNVRAGDILNALMALPTPVAADAR